MESIAKLPAPTQDQWEWQYEGACREADPDLFFHPEGERGAARRRRAEAAKQYCARCPVLETCRERSLMAREPFGGRRPGRPSTHDDDIEFLHFLRYRS